MEQGPSSRVSEVKKKKKKEKGSKGYLISVPGSPGVLLSELPHHWLQPAILGAPVLSCPVLWRRLHYSQTFSPVLGGLSRVLSITFLTALPQPLPLQSTSSQHLLH